MVRHRIGNALFYLMVIVVCLIVLLPFIVLVSYSLRTSQEIFSFDVGLIPQRPSLEAYRSALFSYRIGGSSFVDWARNSLVVCGIATAVSVFVAAMSGYALSRFRFLGRGLLWFLIVLTQTVPWIVLLIPYYALLSDYGMLERLTSLSITYVAILTPVSTWLFTGFFQNMTAETEEAARIDGCTHFGVFARIVLPLSLPAMSAIALFSFVIGWGDFLFASVIVRNADKWTLPLGLTSFQGEHRILWAEIMAMSTLITIPVVVLFLYLQRNLVNLVAGSLK